MDLNLLTIDAARSAVQERKISAVALAESFYARIEADDPKIGAFLTLSKERAMAKAAEMDALAARGEKFPPLGGVPVGIKDVMVTKGVRTTAGSKILGELYSALRLHRGGSHGSGWCSGAGKAELRRICDGVVEREFGMETGSQSARSEPGSWRFFGRIGSGGGGGHGGGDAGFRYRRLYPAAGFVLRSGRADADLRASLALRTDRVRFVARPYRASYKNSKGCGDRAANYRGSRPNGFHLR